MPPEIRFMRKVNKTESCWLWMACRHPQGYGVFGLDGGRIVAHRFSFEMHKGPIPQGLNVLHTCDNPPCVNPEHLYAGTQGDNLRDAFRRGRRNPIVANKITWNDVREMRKQFGEGKTAKEISRNFPVVQYCQVWNIVNQKCWKESA